MRCYRDKEGRTGPLEALYFVKEYERLPRAMRDADLFVEVPMENWDLASAYRSVEQSGWAVRFRCQMSVVKTVAAE